MKVLIVDDSLMARKMLRQCIAVYEDCFVMDARNGVEALEKYRLHNPDIIFLDISMPLLDGLGVLKVIRCLDSHVKIVIVSSIAKQGSVNKECLAAGATGMLSKPFKPETVREFLD